MEEYKKIVGDILNIKNDGLNYEMKTELIEFHLSDGTLYYKNTIEYPLFKGNSNLELFLNNRYSSVKR